MSMLCTLLPTVLSSVGDSSGVGEERRDLCRADQKTDCHSVVYTILCDTCFHYQSMYMCPALLQAKETFKID